MGDKIVMLNQELVNQNKIIIEIGKKIKLPIQALEHYKRLYDSEREAEMEMIGVKLELRKTKTVLVWKIRNFNKKSVPQPIIISPSFSVKPREHLLNVILRHSNSEYSLSIEFCGNVSDRRLVWPFEKRMLITITNQEEDGHEWNITLDEVVRIIRPQPSLVIDAAYNFNRSLSIDEFSQRKYIVDNTVVIHVDVYD